MAYVLFFYKMASIHYNHDRQKKSGSQRESYVESDGSLLSNQSYQDDSSPCSQLDPSFSPEVSLSGDSPSPCGGSQHGFDSGSDVEGR